MINFTLAFRGLVRNVILTALAALALGAPQQQVGDGYSQVRLSVMAATVGQALVTESKYHLPSRVKEGLPRLTPGLVPNLVQLQDELAAISRRALPQLQYFV